MSSTPEDKDQNYAVAKPSGESDRMMQCLR